MDCWKGRIDSTTDYDAFRWHQWVQPLDLNIQTEKPECELGFAFIGFCSEQGVKTELSFTDDTVMTLAVAKWLMTDESHSHAWWVV